MKKINTPAEGSGISMLKHYRTAENGQPYKCFFFCVGVMYSGEYDACDVTLSVYPHRASLKNMPGHGGNQTYDLWNTSPMLCQLSYAVRSVRV